MDTHNTDRSQSDYVNEKSQPKRVYTVCFHLYKSVRMQTYSDRKQVSGCLAMEGCGALIFMFIAVMVTGKYMCQMDQIVHFKTI